MSLITNSFSLQFIYQLFYMGQNKQLFIIFPGTDMNSEDKETKFVWTLFVLLQCISRFTSWKLRRVVYARITCLFSNRLQVIARIR